MRHPMRHLVPLCLALGVAGLASACGDRRDEGTMDSAPVADRPMDAAGPADPAMSGEVAGAPQALDEGAALGVLAAINTAEVEAGQLALRRNVEGPVREYAERMVAEHGRNNEQIQAWSLDTAAPDAQVQAEKGRAELSRLEVLEGAEFARAYVEAMVTGHEDALRALDERLIPAAQRPEVRQHLETTRGHVAAHLEAARQLQGAVATDVAR